MNLKLMNKQKLYTHDLFCSKPFNPGIICLKKIQQKDIDQGTK